MGGVHFTEELPSSGAPSHVHFDEKLHDSVVMVTLEDDGNFMVKVCNSLAFCIVDTVGTLFYFSLSCI